jgi:hypothetical protein
MLDMFREYCYIPCNIFKVRLVFAQYFSFRNLEDTFRLNLCFTPPCPPAGSHPFLTPLKTTCVLVSPAG